MIMEIKLYKKGNVQRLYDQDTFRDHFKIASTSNFRMKQVIIVA